MQHNFDRCKSPKDHCYFHNEDEPVTEDSFKVCYNCFHVYQTIDELNSLASDDDPPEGTVFRTARIDNCPLCKMPFNRDRHVLESGPLEEEMVTE